MADHTGGAPPPPPPPPGFDQPYSAPRGPVVVEPEPYFVATTTTPYIPPTAPPQPGRRGVNLGGTSVIVMAIAGILAAIGGYFIVDRIFFDRDPPTPAQVSAAFALVSGTTYQAPPAEAMTALRSMVSAQPDSGDLIAHLDARALLVGQQTVGVVLIFSVDPDEMTGDYREDYLAGFQATSGTSLTTTNIGGTEAYVGDFPLGKLYTFLDPDGLVFLVVGRDAGLLERTVSSLAVANS